MPDAAIVDWLGPELECWPLSEAPASGWIGQYAPPSWAGHSVFVTRPGPSALRSVEGLLAWASCPPTDAETRAAVAALDAFVALARARGTDAIQPGDQIACGNLFDSVHPFGHLLFLPPPPLLPVPQSLSEAGRRWLWMLPLHAVEARLIERIGPRAFLDACAREGLSLCQPDRPRLDLRALDAAAPVKDSPASAGTKDKAPGSAATKRGEATRRRHPRTPAQSSPRPEPRVQLSADKKSRIRAAQARRAQARGIRTGPPGRSEDDPKE